MQANALRQLLPLSAYGAAVGKGVWRSATVTAVVFFVALQLLDAVWPHLDDRSAFRAWEGVVTAVLFGIGLTAWNRFSDYLTFERVYHDDPKVVAPAPQGRFEARLVCKLLSGRVAVDGQLYVGPDEWVFAPNKKTGRRFRGQTRWEDPGNLSVRESRSSLLWQSRLAGDLGCVSIAGGQTNKTIVVPQATEIARVLAGFVEASRSEG